MVVNGKTYFFDFLSIVVKKKNFESNCVCFAEKLEKSCLGHRSQCHENVIASSNTHLLSTGFFEDMNGHEPFRIGREYSKIAIHNNFFL